MEVALSSVTPWLKNDSLAFEVTSRQGIKAAKREADPLSPRKIAAMTCARRSTRTDE
jgi:hypothetical protein